MSLKGGLTGMPSPGGPLGPCAGDTAEMLENSTLAVNFLPEFHQHVWIPTRGRNIYLLLLRTNSELMKRVDPSEPTVYMSTCEATAA